MTNITACGRLVENFCKRTCNYFCEHQLVDAVLSEGRHYISSLFSRPPLANVSAKEILRDNHKRISDRFLW